MAGQQLPNDVRAIAFDAVGTLIHPEPGATEVYARVGRKYGSRLDADAIAPRFVAAFARQEELDRSAGLRTSEEREIQRWRSIVAEVLTDVIDPTACFEELFTCFSRPAAWRPAPDAARTLEELAARGYELGMASNYDARLRPVVAGLAELRPIRHLIISSEVGWRKPAPPFFAAVCDAVGHPPERVLFVGDDPANDYVGARNAGLRAVLLDAGAAHDYGAAIAVARLAELLVAAR
jgi:putative hydrolase of the HAD superfamily